MQTEKVRNAVLDPLRDRLPFGRRARFFRAGRAVRQIVLGAHAKVALDRTPAHRACFQFAKARRADARVTARQQRSGQRIVLAYDAQLFLAGRQTDQAAAAAAAATGSAAAAGAVAAVVLHDQGGPLRRVVASVVLITERVARGQVQLLRVEKTTPNGHREGERERKQ